MKVKKNKFGLENLEEKCMHNVEFFEKRVSGKPDQIFFCNLNGGVIRNYTIKVAMISVKAQF